MVLGRILDRIGFKVVRKSEFDEMKVKSMTLEEFIKRYGEDSGRQFYSWTKTVELSGLRIPMYNVPMKWFKDISVYSDTVRNIIRVLRDECFKNGLAVEPKFLSKCTNPNCGAEYPYEVDKCEKCGSKTRKPNELEREFLLNWIKKVNINDQPLIEVLKELEDDLNVFDNAYLLIIKDYFFDSEGNIVGAKIKEILPVSPIKMSKVYNNRGEPAKDDEGRTLRFCLEHRNKVYANETRCPICGKKMVPAYFGARASGIQTGAGDLTYYTKGEVIHLTKFTATAGYGIPPLLSVFKKVMTLFLIERYLLLRYQLQRPPQGILMIRTSNFNEFEKAWNWMLMKTKENPYLVYPICVTGSEGERGRIAEYISLSEQLDEAGAIELMRGLQQAVGATYGVMPLYFGESGRGLNNEGLQVTVTNRVIELAQTVYNEKLLPYLVKEMGVQDWNLILNPPEARDEIAELEKLQRKLQIAKELEDLGFEIDLVRTGENEFDIKIKKPREMAEPEDEETEESENSVGSGLSQAFQGEPERHRPSRYTQRFEGEPLMPRKELEKEIGEKIVKIVARNNKEVLVNMRGLLDRIVIEPKERINSCDIRIETEDGELIGELTSIEEGENLIVPRRKIQIEDSQQTERYYVNQFVRILINSIEKETEITLKFVLV